MNGIKTVGNPGEEKFELHWEGQVQTFDNKVEAEKALVKKMQEGAGKEAE